jgi:GNAT superfamily N-acetyltransferase
MTLLDTLDLPDGPVALHRAAAADLPELVALLADDVLGREREAADLAPYARALEAIDRDPAHLLLAARDGHGDLVATAQLTLLPSLSRGGAMRLQIEAVRVAGRARGGGLGTALMTWALDWGREHGASLAQLTTDRSRPDAHRFYDRLGFTPSHVGFKLPL